MNNIKHNFLKNPKSILYPVERTFKISRAIVRETPRMLKATEILSSPTVKIIVAEQGRFLKRE